MSNSNQEKILLSEERLHRYLTPYKYPEPVLVGSGKPGAFDEQAVDISFVFWHGDCFHMLYTGFDGIGYQSALATSDDLLHWEHKGIILPRRLDTHRWDRVGGSATWMIKESNNLYDLPTLKKVDGKYWLVYHSYPQEGYEVGPAEIGLAWTEDEELLDWNFPDQPIYSWKNGGDWEKGGLYKACLLDHEGLWYLFYNAKDEGQPWFEQTGLATSKDLKHWERHPDNPLLRVTPEAWDQRFVAEPCILKDDDLWLNFYFGLGPGHAQEGLAYSKDLIHWTKHPEPIIRHGATGDYDQTHAHKASIVYWNDTLYHFYTGTRPYQQGDQTKIYQELRTILVATDKPLPPPEKEQ